MISDSVEDLLMEVAVAAQKRYDNVYRNPGGIVVVPHGFTNIFVSAEDAADLVCVYARAVVLQNLSWNTDLASFVALNSTVFRLASLRFYLEGDLYDLEAEIRTLPHWTSAEELVDLLGVVGAAAEEAAAILQPQFGGTLANTSGRARRRQFALSAMSKNEVVANALVAALDTQKTTIMGGAEGAWSSPGGAALGDAVFAVTATDIWIAGWTGNHAEPTVWRTPFDQVVEDHVRYENGNSDYLARTRDGRWLGVRMIEPEAADAMADARRSPEV